MGQHLRIPRAAEGGRCAAFSRSSPATGPTSPQAGGLRGPEGRRGAAGALQAKTGSGETGKAAAELLEGNLSHLPFFRALR